MSTHTVEIVALVILALGLAIIAFSRRGHGLTTIGLAIALCGYGALVLNTAGY